jgi:hypothetical protein
MRVSRTLVAIAALVFVAACGSASPEIVAPGGDPRQSGTWIGSGNNIEPDSASTQGVTTEPAQPTRSGTWIGSGN